MTAAVGPTSFGANWPGAPYLNYFSLTPDNAINAATAFKAIYVGALGDITVVPTTGANAVTFVAVPQGTILPVAGIRVNSTGTTASTLVGLV